MTRSRGLVALGIVLVAVAIFWPRRDALVVYCAPDAVYSEAVLRRFERKTGIPVDIRFDTEATKSLGLVERLLSEKANPQCDVFWNNELLGTMALAEAGVLEPYQGSGYARIPETHKDPEGLWTGFAARFRVWIVNREKFTETGEALETKLAEAVFPSTPFQGVPPSLERMAVAVPLYGTTLTQYSAQWQAWGPEEFQSWHRNALKRGLHLERNGNGGVMNRVALGASDFGWTDTDDFFVARDDGKPVDLLPIRIDGRTLAIPNTVAIIKGARHRDAARKLVDFLLSEEVELELARSKSRQVPLGSVKADALPPEVRQLQPWVAEAADLRPLLPARNACLEWLMKEL
jgi:iron(III) transport system substrate-binding protein